MIGIVYMAYETLNILLTDAAADDWPFLFPRLWVPWVHGRCLHKQTIWEASLRQSSSSVWRKFFLLKWIKNQVHFIIYIGDTINIVSDPWVEGKGLKVFFGDRFSLLFGSSTLTKVSSLMQNGSWSKPRRWLAEFTDLWDLIAAQVVGGLGPDDLNVESRVASLLKKKDEEITKANTMVMELKNHVFRLES
ncbi:hypothetical protein QJS04_geneDACA016116 [Acorus gramineus]|uniref:Uncharacterized protein n=1 Tax=Acorus gramineus TaxID=55184 RepID=A0AAV9BY20_ACOGR|nr:hypothetical protein QJS04_geneDACA016116 [Acorus gramineus]